MRRRPLLVFLVAVVSLLFAATAGADSWHSEQPPVGALGIPTPLGAVGDIEFEAPNRGVLITAGNEAMPAGVYAYDGTGWHLYSTVCGGHEGRIAWAGSTDFWTVADQAAGQEVQGGGGSQFWHRSLCHFEDGRVVASYAEPLGVATSYLPINAAACAGPGDCWFAGERLSSSTNVGAFHLHWNGSSLTAIPSLSNPEPDLADPGRSVADLARFDGSFYESVRVQPSDGTVPGEETAPSYFHRIEPAAEAPFVQLFATSPLGNVAEPFRFAPTANALWAVAGGSSVSAVQVEPSGVEPTPLDDPAAAFASGDRVAGAAAEPGSDHIWVSFAHSNESAQSLAAPARLAQIHADGQVDGAVALPEEGARKGSAGPIACPEAGQCWMATSRGWLFHLGGSLPQDTDPAMHQLITTRPADNASPSVPPDELPPDDSGAEPPAGEELPPVHGTRPPKHKRGALAFDVKQRLLHGTLLELRFSLRATAHVQLLAKRRNRIVAKTRQYTMGRGRHRLRLRLDPKRWPTALDFRVRALLGPRWALAPALAVTNKQPPAPAPAVASQETSAAAVAANKAARIAEAATGSPIVEPVEGTPSRLVFLGASPQEAAGEVWAVGATGIPGQNALYRYTDDGGWQAQQQPTASGGDALSGFHFAAAAGMGRTTSRGGVAVLAEAGGEQGAVVRDPGGSPMWEPVPAALLKKEQPVWSQTSGNRVVAVDEPGGGTGAFVVPVKKGVKEVLHFDGSSWSSEQICLNESGPKCTAPSNAIFNVLAIDATSTDNAWMIAHGPSASVGVILLHREPVGGEGGIAVWRRQALGPEGSPGAPFEAKPKAVSGVTVAPRAKGQPLTVTTAGAWLDAEITSAGEVNDATLYFDFTPDDGAPGSEAGEVTDSWCDAAGAGAGFCTQPLGTDLSSGEGRSFAWPPDGSPSDPFGQRTITGVGQGAIVRLEGTSFVRVSLLGGDAGGEFGAALSGPLEGWLGSSLLPLRFNANPQRSHMLFWPVPFRRPLTAVAPQPGVPVGALGSQAIAVGSDGAVARYVPGEGWQQESLLTGSGARATPQLRGVAWPAAGFAYAVGDDGAMWMWRAQTGLWETDPGAPPNLIRGSFTGIAFDPQEPERGYAVGMQGLLLAHERVWTQVPLPPQISPEANFTSIAYAGREALVSFRYPIENPAGQLETVGGLLVNDGSGWRVEDAIKPSLGGGVPLRVAGLPDGGAAVVASNGAIAEREGPGAPWRFTGTASGVGAVAAIREGGQVRAVVLAATAASGGAGPPGASNSLNCPKITFSPECEQALGQPPAGQAPVLVKPFLFAGGTLWRQTASGSWSNEQHESFPLPPSSPSGRYDLPLKPDPLRGLLISPDGSQGWAVGGNFGGAGNTATQTQTATVARFPGDAASPNAEAAPIGSPGGGEVGLAIGGEAGCFSTCADLGHVGIGPDVWLPHAIARASGIPRVRAFLYTGPGLSLFAPSASAHSFAAEEGAYAARLNGVGVLPAYAAASETDRRGGSLGAFAGAFSVLPGPLGSAPAPGGIMPRSSLDASHGYYSFDSTGPEGTVRVIVLDYSKPRLAEADPQQPCWLASELGAARKDHVPAVVVGSRDLGGRVETGGALDAAQIVPILVGASAPPGCGEPASASAYFFDFKGQNREYRLAAAGRSIPTFGTGTLGYEGSIQFLQQSDFVGASGFLLASIDVAETNSENVAPVTVALIPNISELAMHAVDGTLLRRSHVALFEALARRPRAGTACLSSVGGPNACEVESPDPYTPIPSRCQGQRCTTALLPKYRFTSSNPDIADFVATDPTSLNPRALLLDKSGNTVPDSESGLLCAFNAGTTTVTVEAGGLAYSQQVVVQPGSVQQPCGTVPLRNPPRPATSVAAPPEQIPTKNSITTNGSQTLPPPEAPPGVPAPSGPAHPAHHPTPPPPLAPSFVPAPPTLTPIIAIVPPPPPPAVQTTPPSGTSPVTQPAMSPEPEEEEEVAIDVVHHMVAHRFHARPQAFQSLGGSGRGALPTLYYLPPLLVIAALGGALLVRPRRRPSRPAYAFQTTTRRGRE